MPLQVGPEHHRLRAGRSTRSPSTSPRFPLFSGVEPRVLRRMLQSATLRHLEPHEVLVREGEFHERLFVVLDGSVEQTTSSTTSDRNADPAARPGSFHGELAVMGNQEETYTITCVLPATVLEFPKATVYPADARVARRSTGTMEDLYQRRAIWTHAPNLAAVGARCPRTPSRPAVERDSSRCSSRARRVPRGRPTGDLLLWSGRGSCRVARRFGSDERVLQYFREGGRVRARSRSCSTSCSRRP
jgi:hypothetical protein